MIVDKVKGEVQLIVDSLDRKILQKDEAFDERYERHESWINELRE